MIKIVVGSTNPVKIEASLNGFKQMFPKDKFEVEGVSVKSGVKDQPTSDQETLSGAMSRASNAKLAVAGADYYVGIEGGIESKQAEMEVFAWIVVYSKDGSLGKGRTGVLFLPPRVIALINQGIELGEADDIVFERTNSKQSNGTVGILTDNAITRSTYYAEAVIYALIPFKYPEYY